MAQAPILGFMPADSCRTLLAFCDTFLSPQLNFWCAGIYFFIYGI